MPPASEPAPATRARRRRPRRFVLALVIVLGVAGVGGGGFGLYKELTRSATSKEVATALRAEVASRWARLPAGQIFPAKVAYSTAKGMDTAARLVGIAPVATCAAALDPAVAQAFDHHGCLKVLRATYLDSSGTVVVTAGVAVLPSASAAHQAAADVSTVRHAGVRVITFPGTVTMRLRNSQREWFHMTPFGPYVFLSAAGYTTGIVSHGGGKDPALVDLGSGVASQEMNVLANQRKPCQRKDIRC